MNRRNFLIGMGMGLAVGCGGACLIRPGRRCMKSGVGRALKAMGDIADSISDSMGW